MKALRRRRCGVTALGEATCTYRRDRTSSAAPRWHGLLRTRWLTGVGLISYSLYIWHEPLMLALGRPRDFYPAPGPEPMGERRREPEPAAW
ncbi:hypothetical protein DMH26_42840 [Streptomyces sp. WAC 05379]|nr:hypothetical protein DMH26_42840 [Streptomyces sp. WAC 05379]